MLLRLLALASLLLAAPPAHSQAGGGGGCTGCEISLGNTTTIMGPSGTIQVTAIGQSGLCLGPQGHCKGYACEMTAEVTYFPSDPANCDEVTICVTHLPPQTTNCDDETPTLCSGESSQREVTIKCSHTKTVGFTIAALYGEISGDCSDCSSQ